MNTSIRLFPLLGQRSTLLQRLSRGWSTRSVPRALGLPMNHFYTDTLCLRRPERNKEETAHNEAEEEDLLKDSKYAELFEETYIRPTQGHKVFAVQPDNRIIPKKSRKTTPDLQLTELCSLVETLPNWTIAERVIYPLKYVDKSTFFGSGNFAEIGRRVRSCRGVTAAVLGVDMLSARQLATLQDEWGVAVYDRYTVVLQIFQTRAKTKEAKLQVALAEIPYYRSRLHGMHRGTLDKQQGGMKFVGGSGETIIEIRQRLLKEREQKLRRALERLRGQRELLRVQRQKHELVVVAVVGYTNAGKTSLIKALTGDESMQPRDRLFATLDVTLHAGRLPNRLKVLYVDTVGFISDIPTTLVESFAATLEDTMQADVVVHVRDVSHPDTQAQRHNVLQTLLSLNLRSSLLDGMIEVCNKSDLVPDSERMLEESEASLNISVKEGWGLLELTERIQQRVLSLSGRLSKVLRIPMNGPHLTAVNVTRRWLYKEATVERTEADTTDAEKLLVSVVMTDSVYARFLARFGQAKSHAS